MRKPFIALDARDRQAIAAGAAAGLSLMTVPAFRADWYLASGVLEFRRTGQNVAAYVMGLDLLPWALLFTALLAAAGVTAIGLACNAVATGRGDAAAAFLTNTDPSAPPRRLKPS